MEKSGGPVASNMRLRESMYNRMAIQHATVTYEGRKSFDSASVRYLNNFVKACIIDTTCRTLRESAVADGGLRVADIACGRGQDCSKWMYGCKAACTTVGEYYGLDLSAADVEAAEIMSQKYLQATGTAIFVTQMDMGTKSWNFIPNGRAHVVSCQLAFHYLWDKREHVEHFFKEVCHVLTDNGLLLLSFTDGRSVVRRARDCNGNVQRRFYQLDVPEDSFRLHLTSAFGNPYRFTLPGSVENAPEFLCHEATLVQMAKDHGLSVGMSLLFDDLAKTMRGMPRFSSIAAKMGGDGLGNQDTDAHAMDTANLYRFMVLSKTKKTLRDFQARFSS